MESLESMVDSLVLVVCIILVLVCGSWLGLRMAVSGREVGLRLTSGKEVGWRVLTSSDYESRISFLPLVLFVHLTSITPPSL